MTKRFLFFCFIALSVFTSAQTIFFNAATKTYGLKEKPGKIVIKPEYDSIYKLESDGQVFLVAQKKNKLGLFSEKGVLLLPCENDAFPFLYEYAEPLPVSNMGLADGAFIGKPKRLKGFIDVRKNGQNYFFDVSKNTLLSAGFDSVRSCRGDSLIVAYRNGKAGIFNVPRQKMLVAFNYRWLAMNLFEGSYYVLASDESNKTGLITIDGKILLPFEYDWLYFISPDFIQYTLEPLKKVKTEWGTYDYIRYGLTNAHGTYKTPVQYEFGGNNSWWFGNFDSQKEFRIKYCLVYTDTIQTSEQCGIIDLKGNYLVKPEHSLIKKEIRFFGDRFIYVAKEKKVYDFYLSNPALCKYEEMGDGMSLDQGRVFIIKKDGKYGIMNLKYDEVLTCEFPSAEAAWKALAQKSYNSK